MPTFQRNILPPSSVHLLTSLHGAKTQNIIILTTVKASDLTCLNAVNIYCLRNFTKISAPEISLLSCFIAITQFYKKFEKIQNFGKEGRNEVPIIEPEQLCEIN
jgi:hypothetical protein